MLQERVRGHLTPIQLDIHWKVKDPGIYFFFLWTFAFVDTLSKILNNFKSLKWADNLLLLQGCNKFSIVIKSIHNREFKKALISENLTDTSLQRKKLCLSNLWGCCLVRGHLIGLAAPQAVCLPCRSSFLWHLYRCSSFLNIHLHCILIYILHTCMRKSSAPKMKANQGTVFVSSCQKYSARVQNKSPVPNNPALDINPSFHPNIPAKLT